MGKDGPMKIDVVPTKPIPGQKPGTSGLRKEGDVNARISNPAPPKWQKAKKPFYVKGNGSTLADLRVACNQLLRDIVNYLSTLKVSVFQGAAYTENFVQCLLEGGLGKELQGSILVLGGDGRYFSPTACKIIVRIAAANGVSKLVVGKGGFMSTPAVSALIRKLGCQGGILLTASHNPGGPDGDFGIKFNIPNGGPAPDAVTERIHKLTEAISAYRICPDLKADLDKVGTQTFQIAQHGPFSVQVVDPVGDYAALMETIFDFPAIRDLLSGKLSAGKPFKVLIDAMAGATGPYVKEILGKRLGADEADLLNCEPLPDFGGGHPDPNLTYAAGLVKRMKEGAHDLGAAFDGDGDRNMILGKAAFFVTPGDSLAIIADHLDAIPYFRNDAAAKKGYARSMPTSAALDRVGKAKGLEVFETPTGWKYFGNLMDAGRISLCGEESFGTGSDHIREKDGLWACLAWLQMVAVSKGRGVEGLSKDHWAKYGRNVFTRYDYEGVSAEAAGAMMAHLEAFIAKADAVGTSIEGCGQKFTVALADNFAYTDPVDGSVAKGQGIRVVLTDGSRAVWRLSGTGSSGATIRLYIDSYVNDPAIINDDAQKLLMPLITAALSLSQLKELTGREKPTVVT